MAFDHRKYLNQFLADYQAGKFSNNSEAVVVRFLGLGSHYRLIGIHHLTGEENQGNHNLFMDVVDQEGRRRSERVDWGWEGQRPNENPNPVVLDKPPNEPAGNISIGKGQVVWARVLGQGSDRIYNVRTILPDEGPGNTIGHHSHYCVWMYRESTLPPEPEPEPPGEGCADLQKRVNEAIILLEVALAKLKG